MKKPSRILLLPLLFASLLGPIFAQSRVGTLPAQLEKKFLLEHLNGSSEARWEMKWDETAHRVRQLRSGLSRTLRGDRVEAGRSFILEQSELLDLPRTMELVLVDHKESLIGTHLRFEQRLHGTPVYGSQVSVHLDSQQRVFWLNNQPASTDRIGNRVQLTEDQARLIVLEDLKPDLLTLRGPIQTKLYLAQEDNLDASARRISSTSRKGSSATQPVLRYVWQVVIPANFPLGSWSYLVDAESGDILEKTDLLHFARARVFFPNPIVTLKDPTLRDPLARDSGNAKTSAEANCDKAAVPPAAYLPVELLGLSSSGMLDGEFATTGGNGPQDVPPDSRARSNSDFFYERCDSRFNEVNVYYTIDSVQRYIQQLGFRNVNNRSVPINANGFIAFGKSQDQSFYDGATGEIVYGLGGIHDAEDGEIVAHEYGHSIQDNQVPGFGRGGEAKALGEGFSDALAALFFVPYSGGFHDELIGEWDATFYNDSVPVPFLRPVESTKTYADFKQGGDEHRNGTIWAAGLWDFYNRLGATPAARDLVVRLVLESQFLYRPDEGFVEAADALLATDQKLTGGASQALLSRLFTDRKFFRIASNLPAPQMSEAEPNDSVASAQALTGSQYVISGEISSNSDVDYYRFSARANQLYVIEVYAKRLPIRSTLDSFLSILDAAGNPIPNGSGFLENDDIVDGVVQDSRVIFANSANRDLLIRVSSFKGETKGPYLLVVYPAENALRIPRVSSDATKFTGVALSNSGATDAIIGLILLDNNGQIVNGDNPRLISLPAGKQIAFLDSEMFGYTSLASGWLEIHSSSPDVKGYFLYGNANSLLGESAAVSLSTDSVFLLASAAATSSGSAASAQDTEINLINPNAAAANAEITVYTADGKSVLAAPATITLAPFGHFQKLLSEWATSPLPFGHIRVRSSQPIAGFEIHGDQRKTGLRLRNVAETADPLYVLHFVEAPVSESARYFTILNLVNPTSQSVQATLFARDDSGQTFPDLNNALLIIPPLQSVEIPVAQLFNITTLAKPYIGYLEIRGFAPGLLGSVRIGRTDNQSLVAIPIESAPKSRIVFSQVVHGDAGGISYLTGIALLNPAGNRQTALYTLKVFASDGTLVAQVGSTGTPSVIPPGQRVVKLLNELIPDLKPILGGYIVVQSSVPLFSFELLVLPKSLTAVPPQ